MNLLMDLGLEDEDKDILGEMFEDVSDTNNHILDDEFYDISQSYWEYNPFLMVSQG